MSVANPALHAFRRWNWDKIGIGLSSLCMIHCLATPLLFLLLPAVGAAYLDGSEGFHWVMASIVLPVALLAFLRGYSHHRRARVLALGFAGVALLYAALALHETIQSSVPHTLMTIAGSALLLTGHALNWRYCKRCDHAH